jgi:hypothetical protein
MCRTHIRVIFFIFVYWPFLTILGRHRHINVNCDINYITAWSKWIKLLSSMMKKENFNGYNVTNYLFNLFLSLIMQVSSVLWTHFGIVERSIRIPYQNKVGIYMQGSDEFHLWNFYWVEQNFRCNAFSQKRSW